MLPARGTAQAASLLTSSSPPSPHFLSSSFFLKISFSHLRAWPVRLAVGAAGTPRRGAAPPRPSPCAQSLPPGLRSSSEAPVKPAAQQAALTSRPRRSPSTGRARRAGRARRRRRTSPACAKCGRSRGRSTEGQPSSGKQRQQERPHRHVQPILRFARAPRTSGFWPPCMGKGTSRGGAGELGFEAGHGQLRQGPSGSRRDASGQRY